MPDLPHVQGLAIGSRISQAPNANITGQLGKKASTPIYAEDDVCREFGIHEVVRPEGKALEDIVMYGELAQV